MRILFATIVVHMVASTVGADYLSVIGMNNYGSAGNPVYLFGDTLFPADKGYVILKYCSAQSQPIEGCEWAPITPVGSDSTAIKLTEDGFFDAGYGVLLGIAPYAVASFELQAWIGNPYVYGENAELRGQVIWSQKTGGWEKDTAPPLPPYAPDLANPPLLGIPEPSTPLLGLIGGLLLVALRRGQGFLDLSYERTRKD